MRVFLSAETLYQGGIRLYRYFILYFAVHSDSYFYNSRIEFCTQLNVIKIGTFVYIYSVYGIEHVWTDKLAM